MSLALEEGSCSLKRLSIAGSIFFGKLGKCYVCSIKQSPPPHPPSSPPLSPSVLPSPSFSPLQTTKDQVDDLTRQKTELEGTVAQKSQEISGLQQSLEDEASNVAALQKKIRELEARIEELEEELEAEKAFRKRVRDHFTLISHMPGLVTCIEHPWPSSQLPARKN